MNKIFIVLALFAIVSCKTPSNPTDPCSGYRLYTNTAGSVIASALSCTNVTQVQSDIYAYFQTHASCGSLKATGTVADMVCPIVVPFVQSFGTNKLPASWGCTLATASTFTMQACMMIPY